MSSQRGSNAATADPRAWRIGHTQSLVCILLLTLLVGAISRVVAFAQGPVAPGVYDWLNAPTGPRAGAPRHAVRMLILGVFDSPAEARTLLAEIYADPAGNPYDQILASSPDGIKLLDIARAPWIHLGVPIHGDLGGPWEVDQLDVHSQGADAALNLLSAGLIKARVINFYALPSGGGKFSLDDERFRRAVARAERVNVFVNPGDASQAISVGGARLEIVEAGDAAVGIGVKIAIGAGDGGPQIHKWIFHTGAGRDHSIKSEKLVVHHVYYSPQAGHTRASLWPNVTSIITSEKLDKPVLGASRPVMQVVSRWPSGRTLPSDWQALPDVGDWRLVGKIGEDPKLYIPVLVTSASARPADIAKEIEHRNRRHYAGQHALVLLDGDPLSARNQAIITALKKRGYGAADVYVVWNGDLYHADGSASHRGDKVVTGVARSDRVLAQAMWGYALRDLYGRPVIADPVAAGAPGSTPAIGGVTVDPSVRGSSQGGAALRDRARESRPNAGSLTWPVPSSNDRRPR